MPSNQSATSSLQHSEQDSSPVPVNRHTRRRLESRANAYEAAVKLFIEHGYDTTTMEQIAEEADMARATVFNHFPRKAEFLDEWTARRRKAGLSSARQQMPENWTLEDFLYAYMTKMAHVSVDKRAETISLLGATLRQTNFLANPALANELEIIMGEARTPKTNKQLRHQKQAALLIATGYFAVLSLWVADPTPKADLEGQLHAVLDVVLHGCYSRI